MPEIKSIRQRLKQLQREIPPDAENTAIEEVLRGLIAEVDALADCLERLTRTEPLIDFPI